MRFSEHYISPLFEMRRHHVYTDADLIGMAKEVSDIWTQDANVTLRFAI